MAEDLKIRESVKFVVSKPREEILKIFTQAKVGIHTMKEEHFGIAIVEMMSAGLVTIVHTSGGPLHDIIGCSQDPIGYMCGSTEEFADQVVRAMNHFDSREITELREGARKHVNDNFTIRSFDSKFVKLLRQMLWYFDSDYTTVIYFTFN